MKKALTFVVALAMAFSLLPSYTLAADTDLTGQVVKLEDSTTLYYITDDGERYVFPNAKTYHSWFSDFTDVLTVTQEELAAYPLKGNIRYRPGVLLVKIQTDPRVYAVGQNGVLRWLKTEDVAKRLYGSFWNELIDDISPAFFVNYALGSDIDDTGDFNPDQEIEDNETIEHNRGKRIAQRIKHRLADTRRCDNRGPSRICRLDDDESDDDDEDVDDLPGDTVRVCHMPPGNRSNAHTIIIGKSAARAHLSHGDQLGACEGDDSDDDDDDNQTDVTAPVISSITATASTTSAVIEWTTDENSNSKVTFATESLDTASSTDAVNESSLITSHSLELTGLTASTTYYFMVESTDGSGNTATSTEQTFTTDAEPVADTTAPVISGVTVTASTTSALIEWTTNEAADSSVEYATESLTTATSTDSMNNSSLVTSHSLELTGLTASTTYYFILESADADNNTATTTEDSFITL